ncbi:MAG: aminoacyl-tRNA hydrolase [Rhodospirillales bacterium]|nr:aminoacyl-tRNA hydrolase [Rhodospirillales bacterium]
MLLAVGLGNPGRDYAGNRHNIGFMALDAIAARYGFQPFRRRFQGRLAEGQVENQRILALKPETYMNESGLAVVEATSFFRMPPTDVIVFHDEIDLFSGKVRVKRGGGAAGHNGLRSLDAHLGPNYRRVRLGVGHPGERSWVKDHVLADFTKDDEVWVKTLLDAVAENFPLLVRGDDAAFMTKMSLVMQPLFPDASPDAKEA